MMKNGTKGHILACHSYTPGEKPITELEIQGEKILKILSERWKAYEIRYWKDIDTDHIINLEIYLKKGGNT